MIKTCTVSGEKFEISEEDLQYYKKLDVPIPNLCPSERARHRMLFGNQRNLFLRNCDATGKRIVSYYPPHAPNPVYDIYYWWSDKWDPLATAIDFNFSKPFFEQIKILMETAPRSSMHRAYQFDENSEYTNYAGQNKNCYLIFDSDLCRDCLFSYSINACTDVLDCFRVEKSELCYECIDCINCYASIYLQNCENCSDSQFLKNCIGCSYCFGCVNVKNKKYCFFNEQLDEVEYKTRIKNLNLGSRKSLKKLQEQFWEYVKQFPFRAVEGYFNENCIGSYLSHSKNSTFCFDSRELWDCKYIQQAFGDCKDCMDCTEVGQGAELLYESAYLGFPARNVQFSSHSYPNCSNQTYCYFCPSCHDCFACVGLHHKRFCIFNKQYSEAEYFELVNKLKIHLKNTGEWGQTFPAYLSPFEYNISVAQDFCPLEKEEAIKRGYRWLDADPKEYQKSTFIVPDNILETKDSILSEQLSCSESGKNFKIQKAELAFYKKLGIPVPDLHQDIRHMNRLAKRNSRHLYKTTCAITKEEIYTSIPKEWGITVASEEAFKNIIE